MGDLQDELDPVIGHLVMRLREHGVETFESCQSGPGHCFPEPTVRFFGGHHEGFRALGIALMLGMPVRSLRRYWTILNEEPVGPEWEMTFYLGQPHEVALAATDDGQPPRMLEENQS